MASSVERPGVTAKAAPTRCPAVPFRKNAPTATR
jgi:hypothetical protein